MTTGDAQDHGGGFSQRATDLASALFGIALLLVVIVELIALAILRPAAFLVFFVAPVALLVAIFRITNTRVGTVRHRINRIGCIALPILFAIGLVVRYPSTCMTIAGIGALAVLSLALVLSVISTVQTRREVARIRRAPMKEIADRLFRIDDGYLDHVGAEQPSVRRFRELAASRDAFALAREWDRIVEDFLEREGGLHPITRMESRDRYYSELVAEVLRREADPANAER